LSLEILPGGVNYIYHLDYNYIPYFKVDVTMTERRKVEIISLIYKSPLYLNHIVGELNKTIEFHKADPYYEVSARIVGCDPTETIEKMLPECGLSYSIYRSVDPNDYYLNRVYRTWNAAGLTRFDTSGS
jgi:hypothetical protein